MSTLWLGTAGIEAYWPGAGEEMGLDELWRLLASAQAQCEAFAPTLAEGQDVPENYLLAQAMQARALWRSVRANTGNTMGGDDLGVAVFPLDWTVKALLRPNPGRPRIGRGRRKDTP